MFQSKGKGGSFRTGSKRPETRTFVPETLRLGGKAKPPAARYEPARPAPSQRQSTQPFVPETVRISGLSVPVGESSERHGGGPRAYGATPPAPVPSQARPTPLPQPGVEVPGSKKTRDSSLLDLIVPKLGKRGGSAPQPPSSRSSEPMSLNLREPTMDVSETDLSLVEANTLDSTTHELTMSDLSSVSELRIPEQRADERWVPTEPPPPPYRPKSRRNPWLVWSVVGGAWCAMIGLALFAVDGDDGLSKLLGSHTPDVVEHAAPAAMAAPVAAEAAPVVAPQMALPTAAEPAADKPQDPDAPAADSAGGDTTLAALVGDAQPEVTKKRKHHRERRIHKRGGRHGKLTAAQKRKRMKRLRAQRRAAEQG
jgi:hypothetical protein